MTKQLILAATMSFIAFTGFSQIKHSQVRKFNTSITLEGKKVLHKIEAEIQINTSKGTKEAEINIFSNDKPKSMTAHIEDMRGNKLRDLKKKDIQYSSALSGSTFHSDVQHISFKLVHNSFPYIIKYSYTLEYNDYIQLINWIPNYVFDTDIEQASLSATFPDNYQFKYIENQIDSSYITKHPDKGTTTYNWILYNPIKPEPELFAPDIYYAASRVQIIPDVFHYGIDGHTSTWSSFGNWHYSLNQHLDKLSLEEKNTVNKLTASVTDPKEKIKILYHYLQDHTRYINISLELGGLRPYPASYVCQNKYGDCKALTNYMKALLKEAEIKSHYTTIYSSSNPKRINEDYPSQQFNHVILCVPLHNDTIWLECTSSTYPFNYLGSSNQGRRALLIEKDNSRLVRTPKMQIDDCHSTYNTKINLSLDNRSDLITTAVLRGRDFEFFKDFGNYIPKNQQSDFFDHLQLIKDIDVDSIHITRPHRDSSFIYLHYAAKANSLSEKLGKKLLLHPIQPVSFKLTAPEKRIHPVIVHLPFARTDTVQYNFNHAIHLPEKLTECQLESKFGYYKRSITKTDSSFQIIRTFIIHPGYYPLDEYDKFYEFMQQTNYKENQKILIEY